MNEIFDKYGCAVQDLWSLDVLYLTVRIMCYQNIQFASHLRAPLLPVEPSQLLHSLPEALRNNSASLDPLGQFAPYPRRSVPAVDEHKGSPIRPMSDRATYTQAPMLSFSSPSRQNNSFKFGRTYTLVHRVHAHVLVQLRPRVLRPHRLGLRLLLLLLLLLEAVDVAHALAQLRRAEVRERQADDDDRAREVVREVEALGELRADDGEEERAALLRPVCGGLPSRRCERSRNE